MLHDRNTHVAPLSRSVMTGLLPQRAGAGFKPEHLADIVNSDFRAAFFEVHAENYMGRGGAPHAQLDLLRRDYPLSVHGVGLSIGAPGPLDQDHLGRLKQVVDRFEPVLVSEHLAWSTHDGTYFNDLLPLPYTQETLQQVCAHIDEVQSRLGRQILVENPSTYVQFDQSDMPETEFISTMARRTGCRLLLDVNNVHVSATNHDYDAVAYLNGFPLNLVGEIHLAGHATEQDGAGRPLLIDAHDRPVDDAVWSLFHHVCDLAGPLPTLIEWDNDIPEWPMLVAEMEAANMILQTAQSAPLLGRRHA